MVSAVLAVLAVGRGAAQAQLADGIYAVFDTSMGSFTARLHYAEVPMTVASFVGLAEGTQPWIDEETGRVRCDPFFDGQIVNRIADIPERIIQTGSQNGTNSGGGPGYAFPDEFHPSLRHDRPGVVSMANSGLNSNGSQYFFTLGALPGLDDRHAVFGEVIAGLTVLTNIGNVALSGSKPVDDVVFNRVEIRRVGEDAEGFDSTAQGLPVAVGVKAGIAHGTPGTVQLSYATRSNSEHVVYVSSNLSTWVELRREWYTDSMPENPLSISTEAPLQYHSVTRVDYATPLFTPTFVNGGRFTATDNAEDIRLGATTTSGHVSVLNGQYSGDITYWSWDQQAHRGILFLWHTGFSPPGMRINYAFTNATSGIYSGFALRDDLSTAFPIGGDFMYTPGGE